MSNKIQTCLTPEYKDEIIKSLRDLTEKIDKVTHFVDEFEGFNIDNIPSMNTADMAHIYNRANDALTVIEQVYSRNDPIRIMMHELVKNLAVILGEKGKRITKRIRIDDKIN